MEYKTPQGREYGMVYLGKGERHGGEQSSWLGCCLRRVGGMRRWVG